jgi:hypothetical protein
LSSLDIQSTDYILDDKNIDEDYNKKIQINNNDKIKIILLMI